MNRPKESQLKEKLKINILRENIEKFAVKTKSVTLLNLKAIKVSGQCLQLTDKLVHSLKENIKKKMVRLVRIVKRELEKCGSFMIFGQQEKHTESREDRTQEEEKIVDTLEAVSMKEMAKKIDRRKTGIYC